MVIFTFNVCKWREGRSFKAFERMWERRSCSALLVLINVCCVQKAKRREQFMCRASKGALERHTESF